MFNSFFSPVKVGQQLLDHRVVMSPLTRFRADESHVPLPFVADYYGQRASVPGTLLITEATFISPRASGYANVPGLWSTSQVAVWKNVTAAVHGKGSYIFAQLWALGRTADPNNIRAKGLELVSASARPLNQGEELPKPLTDNEIHAFIKDYVQAARNAMEAGFDGVEIHAANGYLIDQFTQEVCNVRNDYWGGSIEARSRFGIAVTEAVVDAIGADRTGIRMSPWSTFQGMGLEDPIPQFSYLIEKVKELKLAYLHLVESRISGNADTEATGKNDFAINIWNNQSPIILAGGFTPESARRLVEHEYSGYDMLTAFGRYFISNPDLPYRIKHNIALNPYDRSTFYKAESKDGYIDYPFCNDFVNTIHSN